MLQNLTSRFEDSSGFPETDRKNVAQVCNLLLVLALFLGGISGDVSGAPGYGEEVIARGKGVEIKRRQLDDAFLAFKANVTARGQTIPEQQRAGIEQRLLDRLILTQLLMSRANEADRAKGAEAAAKAIELYKSQAASEEMFYTQIKLLGMTREQFHQQVLEQAIAEAVRDREFKARISISDERARQYFEEHPDDFVQPEQMRVAHVLLSTRDSQSQQDLPEEEKKKKRAKAEQVLKRAKAGEDFGKLVTEFSEDLRSKDRGGEYTFARGGLRVPEFEGAAFSLQTNQLSEIVTSPFGYHIIKAFQRIPAKKVEFASVKDDIRERLMGIEIEKGSPEFFNKLKSEAAIQILIPVEAEPPAPAAAPPRKE